MLSCIKLWRDLFMGRKSWACEIKYEVRRNEDLIREMIRDHRN